MSHKRRTTFPTPSCSGQKAGGVRGPWSGGWVSWGEHLKAEEGCARRTCGLWQARGRQAACRPRPGQVPALGPGSPTASPSSAPVASGGETRASFLHHGRVGMRDTQGSPSSGESSHGRLPGGLRGGRPGRQQGLRRGRDGGGAGLTQALRWERGPPGEDQAPISARLESAGNVPGAEERKELGPGQEGLGEAAGPGGQHAAEDGLQRGGAGLGGGLPGEPCPSQALLGTAGAPKLRPGPSHSRPVARLGTRQLTGQRGGRDAHPPVCAPKSAQCLCCPALPREEKGRLWGRGGDTSAVVACSASQWPEAPDRGWSTAGGEMAPARSSGSMRGQEKAGTRGSDPGCGPEGREKAEEGCVLGAWRGGAYG